MKKIILPILSLILLTSCSSNEISAMSNYTSEPKIADLTVAGEILKKLPAAKSKIVVSVYDFKDLTGQHKPSDKMAEYSRAVTQGGTDIVSKALIDAGSGSWFTVLERNGLKNLLQERKIIRSTRDRYQTSDGRKLSDIPPLLYAGMLVEGGIISYESNIITGGVGARYLGIGGSTEYRQDIVTVYLRAVNVSNGEIILSVNTSKTIYSTAVSGGAFKYIGINELLEVEGGFSFNEPPQFAVRQAIEMAVYSLVMEGRIKGVWNFKDNYAAAPLVSQYQNMRKKEHDKLEAALKPKETYDYNKLKNSPHNKRNPNRLKPIPSKSKKLDPNKNMSSALINLWDGNKSTPKSTKINSNPPKNYTRKRIGNGTKLLTPKISTRVPINVNQIPERGYIEQRYTPARSRYKSLSERRLERANPAPASGNTMQYDKDVFCDQSGCHPVQ